MNVIAKATREGDWWAVEVPEIPGLFTQAKRLEQVGEMVVDAAELLGYPDVEVTVLAELDDPFEDLVQAANRTRAALREAESAAAAANREAVGRLRAEGLPVRDVATIMGISPQRVSVLASSHDRRAS